MATRAVTISASKKRKNGQVSVVDVARNGGSGANGVGGGLTSHGMRNGGRGIGGGLSTVARNGGSGGSGVGGGLSTHVAHSGGSGGSGLGGGFSTPPHMMVNGFVSMDEYNRLM